MNITFVGCGFASAVLARELAENGNHKIIIIESRDHIAGNCHTSRVNGIMTHHYGPHIFNTSEKLVWDYVNKFAVFENYINRVKAVTNKGVFSLPINLLTINQFFNNNFNPQQATDFIQSLGDKSIKEPKNFEEQALLMIGRELYEAFFYGYTKKQWGIEPSLLPASILKRLPVRFDYNDNYYSQTYQGIPVNGYTELISNILNHKNIEIKLNTKFQLNDTNNIYDHLFFSGPIDSFFNYKHGRLQYRSLKFEQFEFNGDYQGNAVINYCEEKVPFTRITEHKHFAPWEKHTNSILFKEYSFATSEKDEPFYPLRLQSDLAIFDKYINETKSNPNVTFIGRLGTYRYLDMHVVIKESLDLSIKCLNLPKANWPAFSDRNL